MLFSLFFDRFIWFSYFFFYNRVPKFSFLPWTTLPPKYPLLFTVPIDLGAFYWKHIFISFFENLTKLNSISTSGWRAICWTFSLPSSRYEFALEKSPASRSKPGRGHWRQERCPCHDFRPSSLAHAWAAVSLSSAIGRFEEADLRLNRLL